MTREEEQGIIALVLDGKTSAFEELVLAHQDKVYSLALRMTGNEDDARDMAQEAFLKAYSNLSNFRGDSKFSVWLYRLTSNVCIDFLRRRKRKHAVSSNFRGDSKFSVWLYRLTSNVCIDFLRRRKRKHAVSLTFINEDNEAQEQELPDERFAPDTITEQRELRDAVQRGLMTLPDDYRQILVMREISGLSYSEIGEVLDIEQGTVKSRIFRARKRLVAILMKDGNIGRNSSSNGSKGV